MEKNDVESRKFHNCILFLHTTAQSTDIDIVISFTLHLLNFRMQMRMYKCITRMKSRAFSCSLREYACNLFFFSS